MDEIEEKFRLLKEKMLSWNLFQQDDEVGEALQELEDAIDAQSN